MTNNSMGEAPKLLELLAKIPSGKPKASGCTDDACDTKDCNAAIARSGARTVIPPRKNGKSWKKTWVVASEHNAAVRACQRLGRGEV